MSTLTEASDVESVVAKLRRHIKSPEEVADLASGRSPFSYAEWQRAARPASRGELADWEDFLRSRDAEREANLAREAGLRSSP